ncbi:MULTISPECIES: GNAT family N-acetyltransferase [unclassified Arsukibacterium]|uniref:GNAT family N-acetyltransferase n=1 Tax=unclassified Arsukibacterium TaxID=2635278 RepID=UPI000C4B74B5|nr:MULTISPECIES: GNAT family N-acetyltransferase [unclassified Arsukibacterium]MAA93693.1 GNAT family N-acetyltransferase [Rheinheimera sp.]MBM33077.1 GNAT family N-acetyltransferase [Rheinheimera sp.]HAW93085.1 GNAT family N-acetyltransferase [Candidatus Azambacteria bacterium]|tara:strand:+ start:48574 stop:49044 length:471 start_codon:yes stop_codon:yes gene_type:complete
MQWQVQTFADLDTLTLYSMLQLRVDVFVVEQNCPYPELDDKDLHPQTRHIILKKGDKVIAYSRVLAPDVSFAGFPGIGRVCVSQTARRLGLGRVLMDKTLEVTKQYWPDMDIHISAQCYLQQFYQESGFESASEPYLEDDIPHLKMIKRLPQQNNR